MKICSSQQARTILDSFLGEYDQLLDSRGAAIAQYVIGVDGTERMMLLQNYTCYLCTNIFCDRWDKD